MPGLWKAFWKCIARKFWLISVIVHEKDGQLFFCICVFIFHYLFAWFNKLWTCMHGYVCLCVVYCMESRDQHHASTLFLCGCWRVWTSSSCLCGKHFVLAHFNTLLTACVKVETYIVGCRAWRFHYNAETLSSSHDSKAVVRKVMVLSEESKLCRRSFTFLPLEGTSVSL